MENVTQHDTNKKETLEEKEDERKSSIGQFPISFLFLTSEAILTRLRLLFLPNLFDNSLDLNLQRIGWNKSLDRKSLYLKKCV